MVKYLDTFPLRGKRVLMRVDFNVPLDDGGNITDDTRIRAALPSIRYVLDHGGRLVLCSHLGRPKGERNMKFSLAPAAERLGRLLDQEVPMAPDCIGTEVEAQVGALKDGEALLLENLRFHQEETKNDPVFAEALARLADLYVNDAFAVSHRAHASVVGVTHKIGACAGGFLIQNELSYFHRAMEQPKRPLVAILGGAKVSGKLGAISNVLKRVDAILIGGAMANTFLLAEGLGVGASLIEPDLVETAKAIKQEALQKNVAVHLPVDVVVAKELSDEAEVKTVPITEIPDGWMALDIGPATVERFTKALKAAQTIVWNGPMGAFETPAFSQGTLAIARAVAVSEALSIVGGGDTDAAIHMAGVTEDISYMSTGGGAFLTLLEGKELPGIKALEECAGK